MKYTQLLYEWDSPDLHSPVKTLKMGRGSSHNVLPEPESQIFVFTKLPSNKNALEQFLFSHKAKPSSSAVMGGREISQELFGDKSTKNIVSLLKTGEVSLKLVDTSSLYEEAGAESETKAVTEEFAKGVKTVKGQVLKLEELMIESSELDSGMAHWFVAKEFPAITQRIKSRESLRSERRAKVLKWLHKSFLKEQTALRAKASGQRISFRKSKIHAKAETNALPNENPGGESLEENIASASNTKTLKRKASSGDHLEERCQKIPRKFSDDSVGNHSSSSGSRTVKAAASSRGLKLVRLSSTNSVETKKAAAPATTAVSASSNNASTSHSCVATSEKMRYRQKLEETLAPALETGSEENLIKELSLLQVMPLLGLHQ